MVTQFTRDVVAIISSIPEGNVLTYGEIAKRAGNPRGARQVSRTLHTQTKKHNLPWFRVVNSQGKISIPDPHGAAKQKALLETEGIEFVNGKINLEEYMF